MARITTFHLLVVAGLAAANLTTFVACLVDKRRARRGQRRIRERTLLLLALVGGSLGLWLGIAVARHKTRKPSFLAKLLAVTAIQLAVAWLFVRS